MNWYPALLLTDSCLPSAPIAIDIFMPTMIDLSIQQSELFSNGDPTTLLDEDERLVYRFNITKNCAGLGPTPSFSTVTNIIASTKISQQWQHLVPQRATLQSYPFDVYIGQIVIYSRSLGSTSEGKPVRIRDSFGIAVNFEVSLINGVITGGGQYSAAGTSEELFVTFQIQRSAVTKIFIVVVGVANCTLFAFTSIRANLPGAPSGFGTTIDSYTILPVLIIMSFCSVGLLLTILYLRIRANGFEITAEDPAFGQKKERSMLATNCTHSTASFDIQPIRQEEYHLEEPARIYAASLD
ncbi:hypothetical protein CPC08DRAFT_775037 [Agrocybe pediades]|nr:hypothetical protein CPC08DRAFT_775037 [Agrocybe pediades]